MIAKVEPLTPARTLRGPFDYLLAGSMERVGVQSINGCCPVCRRSIAALSSGGA